MKHPFWLSDAQWKMISALLPTRQTGPQRSDDRTIISGIFYVLSTGIAWRECPASYGPAMTVFNRFNRWRHRQVWHRMLAAMDAPDSPFDKHFVAKIKKAHGSRTSEIASERARSRAGPWGQAFRELEAITKSNHGKPITAWLDAVVEWHMDRMFEAAATRHPALSPEGTYSALREILDVLQYLHRISFPKSEAIESKLKKLAQHFNETDLLIDADRRRGRA